MPVGRHRKAVGSSSRPVPGSRREHPTDTSTRVVDISCVARNDMNMQVRDGLSRSHTVVDTNVIAVGICFLLDGFSRGIEKGDQAVTLGNSEFEERLDVAPRNHERMPQRHRVGISDDNANRIRRYYALRIQSTEWTTI